LVLAFDIWAQDTGTVVIARDLFATDFPLRADASRTVVWVKGLAISVSPTVKLTFEWLLIRTRFRFILAIVFVVVVVVIVFVVVIVVVLWFGFWFRFSECGGGQEQQGGRGCGREPPHGVG